jgi:tol-pal system protein YbgF
MKVLRLAPVAFLLTGACFATRSDVRVVQSDVASLRAEMLRADSVRGTQLDRVIADLRTAGDSLRSMSSRSTRFQGDVLGQLHSLGQGLITVQELTGQSQKRLQEMRAQWEERAPNAASAAAAVPPVTATGPTPPATAPTGLRRDSAAAPAPGTPGPNQLYQLAYDQLQRGSYSTARAGFQDLLRQYPTSDLASEAQFYIAESYNRERNASAADAAYGEVVTKYPASPRAATALYKRAVIQADRANVDGARTLFQQVVTRYPKSDEAELARERLRAPK